MKKYLLAFAVLLLSSVSFAWEHPGNPDRFPSLGINYTGISQEGDYKVLGFSQDTESASGSLVIDTRLPLSNSFTLSIAVGAVASRSEGKGSNVFAADEHEQSGGLFSIGGRFYFNK